MVGMASTRKAPLLCRGHSRPVPQFAFSEPLENGNFYVVSSCLDGKPMLRHGVTGDWIGTLVGHKGAVWCSRLDRQGKLVATASADYTARVWSAITGDELQSVQHPKIVKAVDLSAGGERLATGGADLTLRVYDTEVGGADPVLTLDGHRDAARAVYWVKGTQTLVSAGADGPVYVWDVRSGECARQLDSGGSVCSLSLDMGGAVVTAVADGAITAWDTESYAPLFTLPPPPCATTASLFRDASCDLLVTGGSDNWVRVLDAASGAELELHKGHHGPVHCVLFAPGGRSFGSSSDDGTIRLWPTKNETYGLWQPGAPAPAASQPSSLSSVSGASSSTSTSDSPQKKPTPGRKIPSRASNGSSGNLRGISNSASGAGTSGSLGSSGLQGRKPRTRKNTNGRSPTKQQGEAATRTSPDGTGSDNSSS